MRVEIVDCNTVFSLDRNDRAFGVPIEIGRFDGVSGNNANRPNPSHEHMPIHFQVLQRRQALPPSRQLDRDLLRLELERRLEVAHRRSRIHPDLQYSIARDDQRYSFFQLPLGDAQASVYELMFTSGLIPDISKKRQFEGNYLALGNRGSYRRTRCPKPSEVAATAGKFLNIHPWNNHDNRIRRPK